MAKTSPVPSKEYVKLQKQLEALLKSPAGKAAQIRELRSKLARMFETAWHLAPDRARKAERFAGKIANLCHSTLDHCSYFTSGDWESLVTVTQPHFDPTEDLCKQLVLGGWTGPKIISAREWSFYAPGSSYLVILKFSPGYAKAVEAMRRMKERNLF